MLYYHVCVQYTHNTDTYKKDRHSQILRSGSKIAKKLMKKKKARQEEEN